MHDRRDRIEKGERVLAAALADEFGKRRRSERAGGDDHAVPFGGRRAHFRAIDLDERFGFERRRDLRGKAVAVDGERAAGGQLVGIGGAHDQRAAAAHFGMQHADRAALGIVGAERVRTDELGELSGFMNRRGVKRPHFMQHHGHAVARQLPRRFRARKSAADDVNRATQICAANPASCRPN